MACCQGSGSNRMAIFIEGMLCQLCGRPMLESQGITAFSPFVPNQADPLSLFSDEVFHTECFQSHPLALHAEQRYRDVLERHAPENRRCLVCSKVISDADNFFALGHLTDDLTNPMYHFNYAHFHLSHLVHWPELPLVLKFATKQIESGAWKGPAMEGLVTTLTSALDTQLRGSGASTENRSG
jgi:hypothetical protein